MELGALLPAVLEGEHEVLYSPEEISGMVLSELREAAQLHFGPEQVVADVVITVPAYFNDDQRKACLDASYMWPHCLDP